MKTCNANGNWPGKKFAHSKTCNVIVRVYLVIYTGNRQKFFFYRRCYTILVTHICLAEYTYHKHSMLVLQYRAEEMVWKWGGNYYQEWCDPDSDFSWLTKTCNECHVLTFWCFWFLWVTGALANVSKFLANWLLKRSLSWGFWIQSHFTNTTFLEVFKWPFMHEVTL